MALHARRPRAGATRAAARQPRPSAPPSTRLERIEVRIAAIERATDPPLG